MTKITQRTLPNGDVLEIRTNPGATPQIYVNGVKQRHFHDPSPWESWWAWRPVRDIHGQRHWLKKIYRRRVPHSYMDYDDWTKFEYGTLFDLLNDD